MRRNYLHRFSPLRSLALLLIAVVAGADTGIAGPMAGAAPSAHAQRDPLPGNGLIAFSANVDGDFDIFVVDPAREGVPQPLTANDVDDLAPRWSPDGARIAYHTLHPDTGAGDIVVMNADGSDARQITDGGADGISSVLPGWSPDGSRISFNRRTPGERQQIYVMRADGSAVLQVSALGLDTFGAFWSPDGERILFTGQWAVRDGFLTDLFALSLLDASVERLTEDGQSKAAHGWSPDGARVLLRIRPGEDAAADANDDIAVLDVATRALTVLTDDPANDWMPAWAPDGSAVVFVSDRDGSDALYRMDADGGDVRRLLALDGSAIRLPHWQPLPAE